MLRVHKLCEVKMTKHIADRARTRSETTRTAQFARIEADRFPSTQAKDLQRRAPESGSETRVQRFLEIARRGGETV